VGSRGSLTISVVRSSAIEPKSTRTKYPNTTRALSNPQHTDRLEIIRRDSRSPETPTVTTPAANVWPADKSRVCPRANGGNYVDVSGKPSVRGRDDSERLAPPLTDFAMFPNETPKFDITDER